MVVAGAWNIHAFTLFVTLLILFYFLLDNFWLVALYVVLVVDWIEVPIVFPMRYFKCAFDIHTQTNIHKCPYAHVYLCILHCCGLPFQALPFLVERKRVSRQEGERERKRERARKERRNNDDVCILKSQTHTFSSSFFFLTLTKTKLLFVISHRTIFDSVALRVIIIA